MADHGSSENGINCADGHIEYKDLHTVFTEALAGFAHLYAYGVSKVTFLSSLKGRTIHNLEDVDCPTPDSFNHKLVYHAVLQIPQSCLRNQNGALPL